MAAANTWYPPNAGAFTPYTPLEGGVAPSMPAVGAVTGMSFANFGSPAMSTALWAAGLVILSLVLIHVLDEVD